MKILRLLFVALVIAGTPSLARAQASGSSSNPFQVYASPGQSYTLDPFSHPETLIQGLHNSIEFKYYRGSTLVYTTNAYPWTYTIASASSSNTGLYRVHEKTLDDNSETDVYYNINLSSGVPVAPPWALLTLGAILSGWFVLWNRNREKQAHP